MPLIKTVPPSEATGKVADNYNWLMEIIGAVPKPFELMSVSPGLQAIQKQMMEYYLKHPSLSMGLKTLIRLLVAEELGYHYCVSLNSEVLKKLGIMDDDQLAAVLADPGKAPLEDKEKAMLIFVLKAMKTPEAVEQKDIDSLRDMGWSDTDIFDATVHGTLMMQGDVLFKAFKMEEAC